MRPLEELLAELIDEGKFSAAVAAFGMILEQGLAPDPAQKGVLEEAVTKLALMVEGLEKEV